MTDAEPGQASGEKKQFDDFLRAEYNNIAQAHFNTSQSISEFFKAYITVVSLPISAAVIFLPKELKDSPILGFVLKHPLFVVGGLGGVALVGLLVLGYIVNLRCDAVLYARTVNGIRRYFYEVGGLDLETELRYRVLPTRTQTPRYWETHYFLFVVLAFAAVGTGYWAGGLYFYYQATARPIRWSFGILVAVCPLIHLGLYGALTRYRDRRYLKSRILGIDVDGVLNEHRDQFCRVLGERTGKKLDPGSIVRIPVHEIPGCGVNVEDERAVFNWSGYWSEMPAMPGASDNVRKIRNELGYDIWVFTYRPWPHPEWYRPQAAHEYRASWRRVSLWSYFALGGPIRWLERRSSAGRIPEFAGFRPIRSVTKRWLKHHGFRHDKLVVERGNVDTRDPLFLTRNRFVVSARKEIRAFVEDDVNKAKRLSEVCEVVFLVDQPYNREDELPKNVVRVKEWGEVYQYLRRKL